MLKVEMAAIPKEEIVVHLMTLKLHENNHKKIKDKKKERTSNTGSIQQLMALLKESDLTLTLKGVRGFELSK